MCLHRGWDPSLEPPQHHRGFATPGASTSPSAAPLLWRLSASVELRWDCPSPKRVEIFRSLRVSAISSSSLSMAANVESPSRVGLRLGFTLGTGSTGSSKVVFGAWEHPAVCSCVDSLGCYSGCWNLDCSLNWVSPIPLAATVVTCVPRWIW